MIEKINIIQLNLEDSVVLKALFPLYLSYESDITGLKIEEMFNVNMPEENFAYFLNYFKRGITTYLLIKADEVIGFIAYHLDQDSVPGYAEGYRNWAHLAEIYVAPNHRKKGYASLLVDYLEEVLVLNAINKVYLTDISGNYNFWIKKGYIDTNKIEPNEGGLIFEKYFKR